MVTNSPEVPRVVGLLTVGETAGLLRISPQTFYRRVRAGDVRVVRVGRRVLVDPRDVDDFVQRSKTTG
jgi:excisionase family DNA binding protein